MHHPVLVLHRPERRGRQVALSADLLLGHDDSVTISALIGPETQEWVRRNGKRALGGLGVRLDRAKKLLKRYVRTDGDWGRFGDLGALSFDMVREAAGTSRLQSPSSEANEVAHRYLALVGKMGADAQAQAEAELEQLDQAAQSDWGAYRARSMLDMAHAVTSGSTPETEEALDMCRALDSIGGGACCSSCAQGHACDGAAAPVVVSYDAEEAVLMPDETPVRIAGLSADALGYRAYRRVAPKLSMQEAARRVQEIMSGSHSPPGIHPSAPYEGVGPSPFYGGWR